MSPPQFKKTFPAKPRSIASQGLQISMRGYIVPIFRIFLLIPSSYTSEWVTDWLQIPWKFLLFHRTLKTKKPNLPKIYPSAARPSFSLQRPAAFRPLLTKGLALSGLSLIRFSFFRRPSKSYKNRLDSDRRMN